MLALLVPGLGMGGGSAVAPDVPAFVVGSSAQRVAIVGAAAARVAVAGSSAGVVVVTGSTSTDGS